MDIFKKIKNIIYWVIIIIGFAIICGFIYFLMNII
jgi:hypothetical protein